MPDWWILPVVFIDASSVPDGDILDYLSTFPCKWLFLLRFVSRLIWPRSLLPWGLRWPLLLFWVRWFEVYYLTHLLSQGCCLVLVCWPPWWVGDWLAVSFLVLLFGCWMASVGSFCSRPLSMAVGGLGLCCLLLFAVARPGGPLVWWPVGFGTAVGFSLFCGFGLVMVSSRFWFW